MACGRPNLCVTKLMSSSGLIENRPFLWPGSAQRGEVYSVRGVPWSCSRMERGRMNGVGINYCSSSQPRGSRVHVDAWPHLSHHLIQRSSIFQHLLKLSPSSRLPHCWSKRLSTYLPTCLSPIHSSSLRLTPNSLTVKR
jgi:hypothetical protein